MVCRKDLVGEAGKSEKNWNARKEENRCFIRNYNINCSYAIKYHLKDNDNIIVALTSHMRYFVLCLFWLIEYYFVCVCAPLLLSLSMPPPHTRIHTSIRLYIILCNTTKRLICYELIVKWQLMQLWLKMEFNVWNLICAEDYDEFINNINTI